MSPGYFSRAFNVRVGYSLVGTRNKINIIKKKSRGWK